MNEPELESGSRPTPDQVAIPVALPPPGRCRYCTPLECTPDHHEVAIAAREASIRVRQYLREQLARRTFEEALEAAKQLREERKQNPIPLQDKTMSLSKLARRGKAKNGRKKRKAVA